MNKIFSFIILLLMAGQAYAQQTDNTKRVLEDRYRSKSNDQLVIGGILLGAGTGLIFLGDNTQRHATGFDFSGTFIEGVGVLMVGGSIPLFISAAYHHKKAKAIAASLKMEQSFSLKQLTIAHHSFPALAFTISF